MANIEHPGYTIPEWTMADRLRKAREGAGLEQSSLAADLGISRGTVNNYECERINRPRRTIVLAWAIRCGVPEYWLWTGEAPPADAVPVISWPYSIGPMSIHGVG